MTVRVLFFGATADITGSTRLDLEGAGSYTRDLFDRIINDFPALKNHRLLFSINQQYATGDETLRDGDEVAIFTAVSGG